MTHHLNAIFLELERTRRLVTETSSLDELHRVVYKLMHDALAYSNESLASRRVHGVHSASSLDELIETLTNICIALLDSHDIPREHLLTLVDKALAQQKTKHSFCLSH